MVLDVQDLFYRLFSEGQRQGEHSQKTPIAATSVTLKTWNLLRELAVWTPN
jgi:hypothetical protein